ncbi:MAG: terpene cyclase/mutase family protein, partial [Gemmataceae bacterium]|nr:terpene cyclase/mutase family protein [Gemmataceae bacterium]
LTTDVDPAATEFDTDINYNVERIADVSVPGTVNPNEAVGILDGDKTAAPTNLPAPGGFNNKGQGGAIDGPNGNSNAVGELGGYGPRGMPLAGTFYGRSGATRERSLREGGGTTESEAAVARGLKWIARNQFPDGSWRLDGNFPDKGSHNDIAGTAFGLLPLLGAGKTHKQSKDNPYDKPVEKGLKFLILKQNKKTGDFGGGMYGHGLATIAICEAYGMTQDSSLRRPAQMAINFIVAAQHAEGGWRYAPGQAGDTSVTGWQIMALKSGQMAGLDVPEATMRKAMKYLNSVCDTANEGYGYTGPGSTPTMSAVGLLCRQYLESWGPQSIRLIKGIDNHLKPQMPSSGPRKDIYFYYYATQVMHHFGGEAWKNWNTKMREFLIATQDKTKGSPNEGSWSSAGDPHGSSGGRLMVTSLNLLTLEVYYRHLPLYYREAGGQGNMAARK